METSNSEESDYSNLGMTAAQKVHLIPKCITVFILLNSNSPPSFILKDKVPIATLSNAQNTKACVSSLAKTETFLTQVFTSNHAFEASTRAINTSLS